MQQQLCGDVVTDFHNWLISIFSWHTLGYVKNVYANLQFITVDFG